MISRLNLFENKYNMNTYCSKRTSKVAIATSVLFFLQSFMITTGSFAADAAKGEKLFQQCAACHAPHKKVVGPALKGARERWIENSSEENFYKWINNSQALIKSGESYAVGLYNKYNKSVMNAFPLSKEEIDDVFAYVEAYEPPVAQGPKEEGAVAVSGEKGNGNMYMWIVLGVIGLVVIMSLGGVRKQWSNALKEKEGEEVSEGSYFQDLKVWMWKRKKFVSLVILLLVIIGFVDTYNSLQMIGVYQNHQPSQPIEFSHKVHAGMDKIDCQYCHSGASKGRHALIPSVNVCMNCHKGIHEGTNTGTEEIDKVHKAAGFDKENVRYTGKTEPIVWNKVHVLPDHVYFPHDQHVVAGGLDCKQCHGDMTKETTARVMPYEELNALEDNSIKFSKSTLTMGWCLDCHDQMEVKKGDWSENADDKDLKKRTYYQEIHKRLLKDEDFFKKIQEDEKITVEDLGGWECAKCHY